MNDLSSLSRPELILHAKAMDELLMRERRALHAEPGGLMLFVADFWHVLEPNIPLVGGWVLDAMCEHLEAVSAGEIRRLLINVSPGSMKSLLVNVFWPAWEWAAMDRPDLRYVSFSYSAHLTERDNERFRDVVRSRLYRRMYGDRVRLISEGKIKVANDATGWKFASSVGGVGTGERGDRVLLDDPHNVKEAESEQVRNSTVQWFRESMQNRLNDLQTGVIVVIMQRVNEYDVSGCIMENYPDYEHLCIPMENEIGRKCVTSIGWEDPREVDGELSWPERYPESVLGPFRKLPFLWAGQYQQRPEPRGGGILKRDYWRIWDRRAMSENDVRAGAYPVFDYVVASFDGAYTEDEDNDPSALTVWGLWFQTTEDERDMGLVGRPQLMLVNAWRKWLTLHGDTRSLFRKPDETEAGFKLRSKENWGVIEHIIETCKRFHVDKLLIERKATGITVEQELRRLCARESFMIQSIDPKRVDKTARAYATVSMFTDGMIWRPETEWAQMVEDECASFPRGHHDDLVDTTTQALNYLRRSGFASRSDEVSSRVDEMLFPTKPKKKVFYES